MGSEFVTPLRYPQQWDVILVGGKPSPGVATLSGFKRVFGWDTKKGAGTKGSTSTLTEYPPCEGTVTLQLWLPEHFQEWKEFRQLLEHDPTKKPVSAVDIYHPSLDDIGCTRVVCKEISAVEHAGGGLYKVSFSLLEYHPPPKKSAVATPKASKPNVEPLPGPSNRPYSDPIAEQKQATIKKLVKDAGDPFLDDLFG